MSTAVTNKNTRRLRRKRHVRRGLRQHSDLPRLCINRSTKHISAQVIDDVQGKTLAAVSSTAKNLASELGGKTKSERAKIIGTEIAKRAKEAGVETVVFDRGFAKYHGRVKALADAAREGGLKF
jgi:large subunit ribosomal protein L18